MSPPPVSSSQPPHHVDGVLGSAMRLARRELPLVLAVLVGLAIRLYQLSEQIVADDEWHALNALLRFDYAHLFSHFGEADVSIPLTLFYRAAADTIGLSEAVMRAPVLLAGVGALIVLPLIARPYVERPASFVFAWLLAIAPLHVYFSRYARPYSITLLLSLVAVFAFYAWWTGGRKRWAWLYAVSAVLAPYFHLSVLPFVTAPLLFGVGAAAISGRRIDRRSAREVIVLGAAVGAGLLVLLAAPFLADFDALTGKSGADTVQISTLGGAAMLFAGATHAWLTALVALLAFAGCSVLGRERRELAILLAFVSACQIAVAVGTRPAAINGPIVFARYVLPLFPLALLGAAIALARIERLLERAVRPYPAGALSAALLVVLFGFGPIPELYAYPNNWTNHAIFQYRYGPGDVTWYTAYTTPHRIPTFYQRLAAEPPGSIVIMEAPWHYAWHENPYPFYQAVHRQRTVIGFTADPFRWSRPGEMPRDSRFRFRNASHVTDVQALVRRGVRYVVFHRALPNEIPGGAAPRYTPVDVSGFVEGYRVAFGDPVHEDEDLVVFELVPPIDVARAEAAVLGDLYPNWAAVPEAAFPPADDRGGLECYVDWVNGQLAREDGNVVHYPQLHLTGWIVDHAAGKPPEGMTVVLTDGRNAYAANPLSTDRPDVANHFDNPEFVRSGFEVGGRVDDVPQGRYQVLLVSGQQEGEPRVCDPLRWLELVPPED